MAISPDLPGVSITLTIKDQPLQEQDFPDPDPEVRTVNRLIEAQSNQIFEVQMTIDPTTTFKGTELAFRVFVDGNKIDEPLVSRDVTTMGFSFTETSLGSYISSTMVRKYQFADITVVEQQSRSISSRSSSVRTSISSMSMSSAPVSAPVSAMPSNAVPTSNVMPPNAIPPNAHRPSVVPYNGATSSSMPSNDTAMTSVGTGRRYSGGPSVASNRPLHETLELGTIKVEVRHVNKQAAVGFGPGGGGGGAAVGERARRDAARRNITQQVKFTAPQKTTTVSTWTTENVPDAPNPAATFIFHYRSAEGLRSMLAMAAVNAMPLPFRPAGNNVLEHPPRPPVVKKEEGEAERQPSKQNVEAIKEEPVTEDRGAAQKTEDEQEQKSVKLESVEEEGEPMEVEQAQETEEAAAAADPEVGSVDERRRRSARLKRKAPEY